MIYKRFVYPKAKNVEWRQSITSSEWKRVAATKIDSVCSISSSCHQCVKNSQCPRQRKSCHSNNYVINYDFDHCNNDILYVYSTCRRLWAIQTDPFTLASYEHTGPKEMADKTVIYFDRSADSGLSGTSGSVIYRRDLNHNAQSRQIDSVLLRL
jgi:hypothetical protein